MHRARAAAVALSLVPTGTRSLDVRLSVRSRSSSPAPDAGRPTHFVSLRLGDPLLHLAVKRAQELIVAREPRARGCEVPPEKSHLTAFVMRLDSDAAVDQAKQALRSCTCLRAQGVPPPRILLSGLGSFRQDVIFVQAVPSAGLERARVVVQGARRIFEEHGLSPSGSAWTPHLTLLKTSRLPKRSTQRKGRPPPKLPSSAYAELPDDLVFGEHGLPLLELCAMQGVGEAGYYPILAAASLDGLEE